ncbi:MAG: hemolysin III family protein [Gammaproteobacteria bacterium]|nr:hemolysin III family protein [Gammaproteobacteria bacterium]
MQRKEIFNSVSHIVGGVLALSGMVVLIVLAALRDGAWRVAGVSIYGATLVFLYVASSLYHGFEGRARRIFQRMDHVAIYLLIAGTYTPFTLGPLRGPWGWSLFGVLWGLAVFGIVQEFIPQRTRRLSLILYVIMGWLIVIAIEPLMRHLSMGGLEWLVAGGVFYSVGILFFVFDEKWRYAHEIWHLFVLAGSLAQYGAVLFYVVYAPLRGA